MRRNRCYNTYELLHCDNNAIERWVRRWGLWVLDCTLPDAGARDEGVRCCMFNLPTICYLFLGGAGAGALATLGILECVRAVRHASSLPDEFFARAWSLCFVTLGAGMLCLLVDVGRPDRLINLLVSPTPSAIAVGAYVLVGSLFCSGVFAALALLDTERPPRKILLGFSGLCVMLGVATMAYTGILLQSMASVLFWQTPLLPFVFVLSSASCGIALVFLMTPFVETRHTFMRPLVWLARVDGGLIIAETVCLAAYLVWGISSEGTMLAAQALIEGPLSWQFWGGLVVCGLAVPFVLERYLTHGNHRVQLLWIAVFLLVGGFALRFCTVGAATFDETQMVATLYGLSLG